MFSPLLLSNRHNNISESGLLQYKAQVGTVGEILTDFLSERRRRKLIGGSGECSTLKFFGFLRHSASIWSVPFSSDEAFQTADYFISQFQLGKYFIVIKNIFIVKNLTNFRKTVETGVDPRLKWAGLLCWSRTGLNHRVCLLNFRTSGTWLRLNTSFQTNHVSVKHV